jgi:hypothetical protein
MFCLVNKSILLGASMGFTTMPMSESMSVTLIGDVVFECLGDSMTMPFITTKAPLQ